MTALVKNARVAGLLYILASAVGVMRLLYIPKTLILDGNAAATASNIAAHESLFRLGIVSSLVSAVLWLLLTLALYRLLKDVDRELAIVMVILGGLMQVPLFFVNTVTDSAALLFARGADFLSVFDKPQRNALVMLFLNLHHHLDLANAMFWGLWLIPFGLLLYRSRLLPRFIAVWLMVGCVAWVAFSVTGLLFPEYEDTVFNIGQPANLGELVTMLWLATPGVKEPGLTRPGSARTL